MKLTRTIKQASLALASISIINLSAMAADQKADADNTATNQRDRSGETATSGDQSNSSADLKITQAIRQALMKDGELSTTAKNIKVITANGQVTLRGPVNNAQEKAKIDQIARSATGGVQVVDQLDVIKPKRQINLNFNERSLCLNQYSVLQLHRVKLSELFSNFKLKALQIRKSRC